MSTLEEIYKRKRAEISDMMAHMEIITHFATGCQTIAEFGVRTGRSTIALLMAKPKSMVSVDVKPFEDEEEYSEACGKEGIVWKFIQADDLKIRLSLVDLLFIDTDHIYPQLHNELTLHAHYVKKYIILHDMHMPPWSCYGDTSALMWKAVGELMATGEWYLHYDDNQNYGLTVLGRTGQYTNNWKNSEHGWDDD